MNIEETNQSLNKVLKSIEDKETRNAVKGILPDLKAVLGLNMPLDEAIEDAEVINFKKEARSKGGAYFYEMNGKYCAFKAKSINTVRAFYSGLNKGATDIEVGIAMYHYFMVKEVSDPVFNDMESEESYEAMQYCQNTFTAKKGKAL